MKEIEEMTTRLGVDLSAIDLDSTRLPPGDDLGIKSDDEDVYQEDNLEFDAGFGNVIVVDNLPVVPREKFEKLESDIRKIFSQIVVIKEDGLRMPVDPETGKTLGYCFIEFNTPQEAALAKEKRHGFKPDVTVENLQRWLTDLKARDQFVIRATSDIEIMWNDARQMKPDPVYKRPFSAERFVQWSPLGTFLATIHRQGAAAWGGATEFSRLMRFAHPLRVSIDGFGMRTGKVIRDFNASADDLVIRGTGDGVTVSWPSYMRSKSACPGLFKSRTCNVHNQFKESLKFENITDFSWSPTDTILALFVPELGGVNQTAQVSLVQMPSKEEIRKKNLLGVGACKMYWQSNGDYLALAVKVDRYTETKKSTYIAFELFRIRELDIPIEVMELENKNDKIIAFAWEPKGHRFAVIHGDNPAPDISFYSMCTATNANRVSKLITLKGKKANALFWSPAGRCIVLAGLKGLIGQLEFYNVDDLETMSTCILWQQISNGIPLEAFNHYGGCNEKEIEEVAARLVDLTAIDLDSNRLPPGDDLGIKRLVNSTLVVDNLPVVPREKFEKLESVIRKIFSQVGDIKEDGLWIPVDPKREKTLGYCFIEFNTPEGAELAKMRIHGFKLDRLHTLAVSMFDDFDRFMKVPDK